MSSIYNNILKANANGEKLLAVLIDPDKIELKDVKRFIEKVNASMTTHIFIGGSIVEDEVTEQLVVEIKKHTFLPLVLFPGNINQITEEADALLFLSLLSGRNPDYLIDKQVKAASRLMNTTLEVIPTGYILIENGKETAVQRVTGTLPMPRNNIEAITNTAKAGELLGKRLIYLEAGSGATHPITPEIISRVKKNLNIPLIVGGGIRSKEQLDEAYKAGADIVVIGTALEQNELFFNHISKTKMLKI